jgi:hypothetical protein
LNLQRPIAYLEENAVQRRLTVAAGDLGALAAAAPPGIGIAVIPSAILHNILAGLTGFPLARE